MSLGCNNELSDDILNAFSEILVLVYKPCVENGLLVMKCRNALVEFENETKKGEHATYLLYSGSGVETMMLFQDFESDLDLMDLSQGSAIEITGDQPPTMAQQGSSRSKTFWVQESDLPGFVLVYKNSGTFRQ